MLKKILRITTRKCACKSGGAVKIIVNNPNGQHGFTGCLWTLNVCLTLLKKKKNNHQHFASDALQVEGAKDTHDFEDESINQLYKAIRQLSEIDRTVILLYLEEKSYQEISETIGSNPNNIGVRVNRIKERLKKLLEQMEK